jgi:hypothetical protein
MRRVIAIVVVLALIAGGAYYILHDNSAAEEICYDDYIESPAAVSAEGSLEIVTLSGVTYIHAVDVGTGSVEFSDGSVEIYSVKKSQLDVYLLMGQSNAAYTHYDASSSTVTLPGTAYFYGTTQPLHTLNYHAYKEICTVKSMNAPDGTQTVGNIEAPLAASLYESIGNKVLIVNGGVSGVKINTFTPGNINFLRASEVFCDAMERIDRTLYDPTVRSYIWIQGESDALTPVETYKTLFLEIHEDLTGSGVGLFSPYDFDAGFISLIVGTNSSQAQIALTVDPEDNLILGATSAPTFSIENGLLKNDGVHYSQLGDNLIGSELGTSIYQFYKEVKI